MTIAIGHGYPNKITQSPQAYSHTPKVAVFPRPTRGGIKVLRSSINRVYRDRDFGRVEAHVTVVLQHHEAMAPRIETLFVGVDTQPNARPGDLRVRLTHLAVKLAVLMQRKEEGAISKVS